jgi:chlorite dismutase
VYSGHRGGILLAALRVSQEEKSFVTFVGLGGKAPWCFILEQHEVEKLGTSFAELRDSNSIQMAGGEATDRAVTELSSAVVATAAIRLAPRTRHENSRYVLHLVLTKK